MTFAGSFSARPPHSDGRVRSVPACRGVAPPFDPPVLAELERIAAAYPPEAAHTPRWERETYMTELQQLAWIIRFDPDRAAEMLSAT